MYYVAQNLNLLITFSLDVADHILYGIKSTGCACYIEEICVGKIQWWSKHMKADSFAGKLKRLALAAVVWHLWQERNKRVFQQYNRTNVQLVKAIVKEVRLIYYS